MSPRLARTLSRSRWKEYRRTLVAAGAVHGYAAVALEDWLDDELQERPALVLRHDVDQHPASALTMARIEIALGVRSTWYFRWRTADAGVIAELRRHGFSVGFHYETLTRFALTRGTEWRSPNPARLEQARETLRAEIASFVRLFGPIRSVCPHGDTRVPGVDNALLLRKQDPGEYGVEYDASDAMRDRGLGYWLTDRAGAAEGWNNGIGPDLLMSQGVAPILCLTHPNNWASGAALWRDRTVAAVLPPPPCGTPVTLVRTGSDEPPIAANNPST